MATRTRVKVPISVVVKKMEAHRAKIVKDHEAAMKKYDAAVTKWRASLGKVTLPDFSTLKPEDIGYGYGQGHYVKVHVPKPPSHPGHLHTQHIDRDLAVFRAAVDTDVLVTIGDDLIGYFQ